MRVWQLLSRSSSLREFLALEPLERFLQVGNTETNDYLNRSHGSPVSKKNKHDNDGHDDDKRRMFMM